MELFGLSSSVAVFLLLLLPPVYTVSHAFSQRWIEWVCIIIHILHCFYCRWFFTSSFCCCCCCRLFSPLLCGDSYFSIISYGIFAFCALSWSQCESLFHVVMYLNVLLVVVVVVARFLLLADKYSPLFLFFFTISFFFPLLFSLRR